MKNIVVSIFLCSSTFLFSQETPSDPNSVAPPKSYSDPDPAFNPVKVSTPASVAPTEVSINNGHHTLYNKNKQKTKEGFFRDNRLCDGNAYIYNDDGKLQRIAIYKNCVLVKDSLIKK